MSRITIRCRDLTKRFGPVEAVRGVNLALPEGRFLALLGPSGCGKTTVLRLLAGFETPDSGEIEIAGQSVNAPGRHVPPEQRQVGMVFQEYALFPHMTVADNVAYGIPKGVNKAERVAEVLNLVGLADVKERMPYELSGGQQQRIALARALAPRPAVILLDEPFSNLDARLRGQVRREVRQILRQAEATVIFVTHDQEEAFSLADEVAVMIEGCFVQVDGPQKLYQRPATRQVATFLGEANFLPGQANDGQVECELGRLPAAFLSQGEVEVMFRPEELEVIADEAGPAEIIEREYFGHNQLLRVRLASGREVHSRLLGSAGDFYAGQKVGVRAAGNGVVYPAAG